MNQTICQCLLDARNRNPELPAITYPEDGTWKELNWPQYFSCIERIGAALSSMGIRPGSKVAIISNTRLEWAISDYAILGLGAITVLIYQS